MDNGWCGGTGTGIPGGGSTGSSSGGGGGKKVDAKEVSPSLDDAQETTNTDNCTYTDYYCGSTDSNRLPDYITLNIGASVPGLGTIISGQVPVTLDRYGNLYIGGGLALGPEAPLGVSASLSAGYIQSDAFLLSGQSGMEPSPGEERTEQILSGGFVNAAICFVACVSVTKSVPSPHTGLEIFGIGFPQFSVGGGGSFLIDFTPNSGKPLW